jgi:hypothetical protein
MRTENKFLIVISVLIFSVFLTGFVFYFVELLSPQVWKAFLSGGILTTLNFFSGILSLRIALKSGANRFLSIVLGGMLIRMALMLGIVFIWLKFLQIKDDVFIFVIFIFYSFYLIAEIFYFYLLKGRTE